MRAGEREGGGGGVAQEGRGTEGRKGGGICVSRRTRASENIRQKMQENMQEGGELQIFAGETLACAPDAAPMPATT